MLVALTHYLPEVKSHMDCRHADKVAVVHALRRDGFVWLAAETDSGFDDFLAVVCHADELGVAGVFRLDMSGFKALGESADYRSIIVDGDINRFCNALCREGRSILLLDNVTFDCANPRRFFTDLSVFIRTVRDVSSETLCVVRSYRAHTIAGAKYVSLLPLDAAECQTYVETHPLCGYVSHDDVAFGFIHESTGGYPGRVDRLLSRLKSIDLAELMSLSSGEVIEGGEGIPDYLKSAVEEISENKTSDEYRLAKGLSVFPFGESLDTLKYFDGGRRIRSSAIDNLIECALADPADSFEVGLQRGEQRKYVVIKKNVQDYILCDMGEQQLEQSYVDAVAVYFGKDWRLKEYNLSSSFQMSVRRLNSVAEQNAAVILARFISDIVECKSATEKDILDRIGVIQFYVKKLDQADKYLFVTRLGKVLLPKLAPFAENHWVRDIHYRYARSLRMLGRHDQSIHEFERLLSLKNDVRTKAHVNLNLAYSYKSKGENLLAIECVDTIKNLKYKGDAVYSAESIRVLLEGGSEKNKKLRDLAAQARKDKCHVAANNIEIDLVEEMPGDLQRLEGYKRLIPITQKTADEYNYFDVIAKYCDLAVKHDVPLVSKEVRSLIDSYKFSCSQWQMKIFANAHSALWGVYEKQSDTYGLIQLFRHSSILQRLTNKRKTERYYLQQLVKHIDGTDLGRLVGASDQVSLRYFVHRAVSYNLLTQEQVEALG